MQQIKRGVKSEDEFIGTIQKLLKYIVRHRETSIWIGGGIVVGFVILIYFFSKSEPQKPEADLLQTQAIGYMTSGNIQEAENILLQLTEKYQNTRPGKIGLYYLGVLYHHTGRFAEALDYFDRFLQKEKNDYLLTSSALLGAGSAAEGMKDYEQALNYYARIIENKDSKFYLPGMLAYGRVSGIIGDTQKAKEILEKLLEQNPPTDIANDAKFYLGFFNK